jgi:hypothetical protein
VLGRERKATLFRHDVVVCGSKQKPARMPASVQALGRLDDDGSPRRQQQAS